MYQLYNIDAQLMSLIDQETGEVKDLDAFIALTIEHNRLVEGVALWVQDLKRQSEAIAAEVKRLQERKEQVERQASLLAENLGTFLDHQKFQGDLVTVSFRRTEAVEVERDAELPPELTRTKVEPDKTAIKAALKAGQTVPGCSLVKNISTIIR